MSRCPLISIIVPVYNVEKYLHICILSILEQSFKDFELILINDGSTDKSGFICNEFADKDSRIKVYHVENGGVSNARNIGIKKSSGLWICFVDSDDWLDPSYLSDFAVCDNSCMQLLVQGYKKICDDKVISTMGFKGYSGTSLSQFISYVELNSIINSPCFKLFRKDIIDSHSITFDSRLSYGEDHLFTLSYMYYVSNYNFSLACGYNYRVSQGVSLTNRIVPVDEFYYYILNSVILHRNLSARIRDVSLTYTFNYIFVTNVIRMLFNVFEGNQNMEGYRLVHKLVCTTNYSFKGLKFHWSVILFIINFLPRHLSYSIIKKIITKIL